MQTSRRTSNRESDDDLRRHGGRFAKFRNLLRHNDVSLFRHLGFNVRSHRQSRPRLSGPMSDGDFLHDDAVSAVQMSSRHIRYVSFLFPLFPPARVPTPSRIRSFTNLFCSQAPKPSWTRTAILPLTASHHERLLAILHQLNFKTVTTKSVPLYLADRLE